MQRRSFLQCSLGALFAGPLAAAVSQRKFDEASELLRQASSTGQVSAAALYCRQHDQVFAQTFGASTSIDDIFLLASISKPMSVAALMTLFDKGAFRLNDQVSKYLPEFSSSPKGDVTIRHLLTHVSGLPDQLPENESLRRRHAALPEFVRHAMETPLLFAPGTEYRYSSMGILLASEVARRLTGVPFAEFMDTALFRPLKMTKSALGLGRMKLEETMTCQVEQANPESGSGDPSAQAWDWNSPYWRGFGAPWGGVHASAPDVARFFGEFLDETGRSLTPQTARLMIRNHNSVGLRPRGLGFDIGEGAGSPGCSERTFGHSGATGTLAWADPATKTICVVLTTLPARAANPHPRQTASDHIAAAAG